MKYVFSVVLAVHGLIHLIGFAKAFSLANVPSIHVDVSRPAGVVWLVTAIMFVIAAILVVTSSSSWWIFGSLAVIPSQVLIIQTWSDSKYGTIVNCVILIPLVISMLSVAPWSFARRFESDVATSLQQSVKNVSLANKPLTENDIHHLPDIVQQYLHFTGSVGRSRIWNYRVSMKGRLRSEPSSDWMEMQVQQHSFVRPNARHFLVHASMYGVPADAYHCFVASSATFTVKVANLFTTVSASGPEMNQSETVTLLNDMFLLAPATLIDSNISWESIDSLTVQATFSHAGNVVHAVVTFDSDGKLRNFISDDRYRTVDGITYERLRWSTPVQEWRTFNGRTVAARASAYWTLPSGDFSYAEFDVLDATYNVQASDQQSAAE
ncbi:MAG TPA: hypothetical protein PLW14_07995 [Chlorobiota bacterium]|mgnify:CR=1 FL=1|nr:hypothetical protein [Chlorobiota bacterium]